MSATLAYLPSSQSAGLGQTYALLTPANDNVPLGYNCHLHLAYDYDGSGKIIAAFATDAGWR